MIADFVLKLQVMASLGSGLVFGFGCGSFCAVILPFMSEARAEGDGLRLSLRDECPGAAADF